MRAAVLGTGNMGKALVKQLSTHGAHTVLWGSRNPEEAEQLVQQLQLSNVEVCTTEAALQAQLIIPAYHAAVLKEWAAANREQLVGKIVVDISNPFNADFTGFTTSWGESSAEQIQALLPESKVVGAFKNTFFKVVEEPQHQGRISDVLVTGDDDAAVETFMAYARPLPYRFLHAGKLANNRTIERFTLLELELAVRYNTYPYIAMQIFGIPEAVPAAR
jgi:8-hydroxy-5-deazaflavin:NADPH oxidoreductase